MWVPRKPFTFRCQDFHTSFSVPQLQHYTSATFPLNLWLLLQVSLFPLPCPQNSLCHQPKCWGLSSHLKFHFSALFFFLRLPLTWMMLTHEHSFTRFECLLILTTVPGIMSLSKLMQFFSESFKLAHCNSILFQIAIPGTNLQAPHRTSSRRSERNKLNMA